MRRDTLLGNERGAVALLFALIMIPVIGFAGLAIDAARVYSVKMRLQESIDGAALVGAKNFSASDRDDLIEAYFRANWRDGFMLTDVPQISITQNEADRTVDISASVNMDTVIMGMLGTKSVKVGTLGSAVSGQTFLEVALALDNTASMNTVLAGGSRRIDVMKDAAKQFIDTLYTEGGVVKDTLPELYVSVVPFTSMVNIGNQHTNMLVASSTDDIVWAFPKNDKNLAGVNSWRGCVFERSFYADQSYKGYDMTDNSPGDEKYWPYHVVPTQFEVHTRSNGVPQPPNPPPAPQPPAPPKCYGPAPIVPCPPAPICTDGDGNVVTCPTKPPETCYGSKPEVPCPKASSSSPSSFSAAAPAASSSAPVSASAASIAASPMANTGVPMAGLPECPIGDPAKTPAVSNGRYQTGTGYTYWNGYNTYVPYAVYRSKEGLTFYHPEATRLETGFTSYTYNAAVPSLSNNSGNAAKNNGYSGVVDGTGVPIYCYGGQEGAQSLQTWTQTGRWIRPWPEVKVPTHASHKFGGWGNSGCGLPLLPLVAERTKLRAKIDEMDITGSVVEPGGVTVPQYGGTLIQQGLAWGWRTISPNWRGWWKNSDGTDIDADLPIDYGTNGSTKAVVVMTDGLNFLPDPFATQPNGSSWFIKEGTRVTWATDTNLSGINGGTFNLGNWVDSSAYGVMNRQITTSAKYAGNQHGALTFCRLRQAARGITKAAMDVSVDINADDAIDVWGCREYECMLRDASGANCLKSSPGNTSDKVLYGPYYDELERRLLKTCSNMVAQNVRPYFILFDIDNNPQKTRTVNALKSCAGSLGGVYDAMNATELYQAFNAIAIQLRQLRLVK